jgi:hypothetical protein
MGQRSPHPGYADERRGPLVALKSGIAFEAGIGSYVADPARVPEHRRSDALAYRLRVPGYTDLAVGVAISPRDTVPITLLLNRSK